MPNLSSEHAHSAGAQAGENSGARTRRGGNNTAAASERASRCTAGTSSERVGTEWFATHGAADRSIVRERRRAAGCGGSAGRRRSGASAAVCLTVLVSLLSHLRAVDGLSDNSQRAKSYMRFGGIDFYSAYYDSQVRIIGDNFFDPSLSVFRSAAGLGVSASEQQVAQAILQGPSHMSLKDTGRTLYGNPSDYSSGLNRAVTLEAFVRVRDKRVLTPPRTPDDPIKRVGGAHIRLPLMGNMRHRWGPSLYGQGYQLSCAYDGEPVCCAEAYTTNGASSNPNKPDVSACVSIKPMIELNPAALAGEPGGDCTDSTNCGTSWFHITGRFAGGYAEISVNQSSAYYSQSTYSATSDKLQPFQHGYGVAQARYYLNGKGMQADSIQVRGKKCQGPGQCESETATSFALASSIPFAANGDVIGELDDNMQYLFLRCDMDEVKIWVNEDGTTYSHVRSSATDKLDVYEGVGKAPCVRQ